MIPAFKAARLQAMTIGCIEGGAVARHACPDQGGLKRSERLKSKVTPHSSPLFERSRPAA
ncbi:MAG: hypothetical protein CSA31_01460 [Desulfobulbus propionicus]|nr:MAG: hypothetical protein CSA31_01460 [Desulfobulbus propionicus]